MLPGWHAEDRTREDRKLLSTYQRIQAVDSGYAGLDELLRVASGCRVHRQAIDISSFLGKNLRAVIDRAAQAVEYTAQHVAGYSQFHASSKETHFTVA